MIDTKGDHSKPGSGFYYHYKHDPSGSVDNYAYEVIGVGHHTEDDCRPQDQFLVVYRPLYRSALVYLMGQLFDIRPREMFLEEITKDGIQIPRFTKITDTDVVAQLSAIRDQMYRSA